MSTALATKTLKREVVVPENDEHWLQLRSRDLTSTEIAALFGVSPYLTEFELWHRKKKQEIQRLEENERMKWGSRLEGPIARGIAEDNGWKVREVHRYIRLPEYRLGSSFDFEIVGHDSFFEIKLVDGLEFMKKWVLEDGSIEAPLHIELQAQHQIVVGGKSANRIGALVGGNRPIVLDRPADRAVGDAILQKTKNFWASIDANVEPDPDFKRDAAFIAQLYSTAQKGRILIVDDVPDVKPLVARYTEFQKLEKQWGEEKQAVKAQILTMIGDAEKLIGDDFSISAGEIADAPIAAYVRKGYRNFRVSWKKAKEA